MCFFFGVIFLGLSTFSWMTRNKSAPHKTIDEIDDQEVSKALWDKITADPNVLVDTDLAEKGVTHIYIRDYEIVIRKIEK